MTEYLISKNISVHLLYTKFDEYTTYIASLKNSDF